MKISIKNFRRVNFVEITTRKITVIAGKNEAGKTSAMQGIAAVLTGKAIPFDGLQKNQITSLIHSGMPKASIFIEDENGVAGISYPDCKRITEGNIAEISLYSAGLKSIVDEHVKTRPDTMAKVLNAIPGANEIKSHLGVLGVDEASIKKICDTIDVSGWDEAYRQAQEAGARLKGSWEQLTSKRYGSKIASEWTPDAWSYDLSKCIEQELVENAVAEREWLEVAIADCAVMAISVSAITAANKDISRFKKESDELSGETEKLRNKYKKTKVEITKVNDLLQPAIQKCPICSADLMVKSGLIERAELIPDSEIEKRRCAVDVLNADLVEISEKAKCVELEHQKVRSQIAICENIINKSSSCQTTSTDKKPNGKTVDECRTLVKAAEEKLRAFTDKVKADKINSGIETNKKIIDLLSTSGLRLQLLNSALKKFNETLEKISKITTWGDVVVMQDMSIVYRGWPYVLISESAKWRVRVSLQIAFALESGDEMLLIDGADILDRDGKEQLIKLLLKIKTSSIVAMTLSAKEKMPSLQKVGGVSCWIENGISEYINQ